MKKVMPWLVFGSLPLFFFLAAVDLSAAPRNVRRVPNGIPAEYIVVLEERISERAVEGVARSLAAAYGVSLQTVWSHSLRGFFCTGTDAAIDAMAGDPRVFFIEQNALTHVPPDVSGTQWTIFNGEYLWHLDRLDELSWAHRDSRYNMCPEARSVYAYVIDIGVWRDHPQFEVPSRVVSTLDFSNDRTAEPFSNDATNACANNSLRWHGTAVASVLAGTQVGAAKTQVVSLKIQRCADGEIRTQHLINALDWIADGARNPFRNEPGVMNHSGFVPLWDIDNQFNAYSEAVARTVTTTNLPFFSSADNFSQVFNVQTPQYWMCADPRFGRHQYSRTVLTTCPAEFRGPFHFPSVGNDSDARMAFWDAGTCP